MFPSSGKILGISTGRVMRLTAIAVSGGIIVSLALSWLNDQLGTPASWRAGLFFLEVLEVGYLPAVACALVGTPALALLILRRRRNGVSPRVAARGLLVCVSLLLGLVMAEVVCAVWLHRAAQSSAVPIGGLSRGEVDRRPMWPPVSLADVELPTEFNDPPGESDVDLVVVGESSAEGVPYNFWLSIGRLVAWKLGEAIPGRPVRLRVLANSGDTLEIQHKRLDWMDRRPDLMIVYCGHNEFGSRLHGGRDVPHYLDERTLDGPALLLEQVKGYSPFCELIRRGSENCRLKIPPSAGGHRDLIDTPAYTAGEYALLLADFRRRLEAIVTYAERVGAMLVLIVPPGNDTGFEPNRSFLPAATPRREREEFRRLFLEARRLEATDSAAAIASYRGLVDRQPGFAEAHYRLGLLLDKAGDVDEAYRHFVAARDLDGYPVRCLTAFQDVYREIAARHGVILVDGQAELHAIGRRGLLDDQLFQDAMHPSLRGQIALSQAILRSLRARRAFGWPESVPAPLIDPAQCARHFGLDIEAWKKICLWGIHFNTFAQGLRYDQGPRLDKKKVYADAYERLVAGEAPEAVGLPHLGIPEPVPAVADGDPPRMTRTSPP